MTSQTSFETPETVLFYDGACPLCAKEMSVLRRYADGKLQLKDIHSIDFEGCDTESAYFKARGDSTENFGSSIENKSVSKPPSKKDLLLYLHARTAAGQWVTGADANVLVWQHTKYGSLFKILRWPIIRSAVDFVYKRWAIRRYQKNLDRGLYD